MNKSRPQAPQSQTPQSGASEPSPFRLNAKNSGFPEIVAPESSRLTEADAAASTSVDESAQPQLSETDSSQPTSVDPSADAEGTTPEASSVPTDTVPPPAVSPAAVPPHSTAAGPTFGNSLSNPSAFSMGFGGNALPAPLPMVTTTPSGTAASSVALPSHATPATPTKARPTTARLIPFPNAGLHQSQQEQPEFVIPLRNDEYLPALSRWTTWGGLVLLSAMGAAAGLASVTPAPVLVRAGAVVRPQGELKVVQAIAEGTIETIKVEEGQEIHRGQPIAVLDDSRLQTRQRQLESGLQQRQMQLQQIQAQIGALGTQQVAEVNLTERAVASARAEVLRIEREYSDRKAIAEKEVQESEALLASAQVEYESYAAAAAAGVLPRVQAENKRQAYKAAQARLERAQTSLNPSNASITMARENIAQTMAQGESTLASLQRQREALMQQQSQIRQQMEQDQQELAQVVKEFDKMVIRSQVDGELLKLNLRNEGQVVRSGETLAQVFPKDAPLEIKAKVSPQDIGKVEIGQRVNMRVSAYSYADYGTLDGVVTAISADAIAPQNQAAEVGGGPAYFEVTIQPEQSFLIKESQKFEISPGMEIQADIVSRDETVMTLILRRSRLLTGL